MARQQPIAAGSKVLFDGFVSEGDDAPITASMQFEKSPGICAALEKISMDLMTPLANETVEISRHEQPEISLQSSALRVDTALPPHAQVVSRRVLRFHDSWQSISTGLDARDRKQPLSVAMTARLETVVMRPSWSRDRGLKAEAKDDLR